MMTAPATPARYRKKPVVIEAQRVPTFPADPHPVGAVPAFVDEALALAEWCNGISYLMTADGESAYEGCEVLGPHIAIRTLEGTMAARPGDWIISGVQGEFYPCAADIFEATYDAETGGAMTDTATPALEEYRAECSRLLTENAQLRAEAGRLRDACRFIADGMCSSDLNGGCDQESEDGLCEVCTARHALAAVEAIADA